VSRSQVQRGVSPVADDVWVVGLDDVFVCHYLPNIKSFLSSRV
jgi:hypothetical protein